MDGEADPSPRVADELVVKKNKSDSETESDIPMTSSSSNVATTKMTEKTTPGMVDYWKKMTITEDNRQAYHSFERLNGGLESTVPTVEYPTVDGTTVVCFESHLVAGLGLLPSKFLIAVMSHLGCELVHLNPNTIVALSYFTMLCECWLEIVLDTSIFWYFYSSARYEKVVFSDIGLSFRRNCWDEYIHTSFKGSWKGASRWWFLVDMHVQPQWANMYLLLLLIDKKRGEPKMTPRLVALVKQVTELHESGLRACHYAEEFTLWRIRPLGRREKLSYECPRLADPSREPIVDRILTLLLVADGMLF
jgi:hypothetical protein